MQLVVVFLYFLYNFYYLFFFFIQLQFGQFYIVRVIFVNVNYCFGIQGVQIVVKFGFKGVQGRLVNFLFFIDYYFNVYKSYFS